MYNCIIMYDYLANKDYYYYYKRKFVTNYCIGIIYTNSKTFLNNTIMAIVTI